MGASSAVLLVALIDTSVRSRKTRLSSGEGCRTPAWANALNGDIPKVPNPFTAAENWLYPASLSAGVNTGGGKHGVKILL